MIGLQRLLIPYALLFGSAANGEMTEASDSDLIVIYDNDSDLKEIQKGIFMNLPKDDGYDHINWKS